MSSMPPPPPPPPQPPPYQPPPYGTPSWPQQGPQQGPPPDASKKIAAGICGILIGWLGIHKFILGMNKPGLIMVLVSVLTCGIGGVVMQIIGIIEGIIYLTKSDQEFYQLYVVQKKEWF